MLLEIHMLGEVDFRARTVEASGADQSPAKLASATTQYKKEKGYDALFAPLLLEPDTGPTAVRVDETGAFRLQCTSEYL
jgi:hypothetical protein